MGTKSQQLLQQARLAAERATTWADLSNALFDPQDGMLVRAYPLREERVAFIKTKEYEEIQQLVAEAMERTGLVEGAWPTKSGKFVVRLPKSLHASLDREAAAEGVSLNQLVVAKLAAQLSTLASGS